MSSRWYHTAFGLPEQDYQTTRQQFAFESGVLKQKAPARSHHVGCFETPSLHDLRNSLEEAKSTASRMDGCGSGLTFRNTVARTLELHRDPANAGAVFQVASLFNCLQLNEPSARPEDGITNYANAGTQGAACAVACPAATLYRNYLVNGTGQQGRHQLDCLADLGAYLHNDKEAYWVNRNGFCMPRPPAKIAELGQRLQGNETVVEEAIATLRVGVHWDTQVGGCSHNVCQVFCSTAPVAFTKMVKANDWAPFASLLLKGGYLATLTTAALLAAQRQQRVKVFLTAIGGGALGNRTKWIISAISHALHAFAESPLDVVMVHFATAGPFATLETQGFTQPQAGRLGRRAPRSISAAMESVLEDFEGLDPTFLAGRDQVSDDPKKSGSAAVMKAFAFFDANGDGVIDASEFEQVLMSLDPELFTESRIKTLLSQADADGDGDIHYTEFVSWLFEDEDSLVASRVFATACLHDFVGEDPGIVMESPSARRRQRL